MELGWTWGEEFPTPEDPVVWPVWKYKESAVEARNTGDWGRLELEAGEEFVSDVKDTGGTRIKFLETSYNDYDVGFGTFTIQWRGASTPFAQDSDETTGPTWEAYVPQEKTWRYVQVKVTA